MESPFSNIEVLRSSFTGLLSLSAVEAFPSGNCVVFCSQTGSKHTLSTQRNTLGSTLSSRGRGGELCGDRRLFGEESVLNCSSRRRSRRDGIKTERRSPRASKVVKDMVQCRANYNLMPLQKKNQKERSEYWGGDARTRYISISDQDPNMTVLLPRAIEKDFTF